MIPSLPDLLRKHRIFINLPGPDLLHAIAIPTFLQDIEEEAHSTGFDRLVTPDFAALADSFKRATQAAVSQSLLSPVGDVIIVPGLLASQLTDKTGGNGLIWINPRLVGDTGPLLDLGLKPNNIDEDSTPGVSIQAKGAIPVVYAGLEAALEFNGFHVDEFGFDWRKNIDASAARLADFIRNRPNPPDRPLHLIAHSQGSLVARKALQLLGKDLGLQLVNSLVLLAPATAGSFEAATGIAGSKDNELLSIARQLGITPPEGFTPVLQSMSGLYQLLPWRTDPVDGASPDNAIQWLRAHPEICKPPFWNPSSVDTDRLGALFGSAESIDSSFMNGRTSIILGDLPTVGGVMWVSDPTQPSGMRLANDPEFTTSGDGTVPDSMALVEGVTNVFKAPGAEHATLPLNLSVIAAVLDILQRDSSDLESAPVRLAVESVMPGAVPRLSQPPSADELFPHLSPAG